MNEAVIHIAPPEPKNGREPNAWTRILDEIQPALPAPAFHTWLAPTTFDRIEDGVMFVHAPDREYSLHIRAQYIELIVTAVRSLNLPVSKIVFEEDLKSA